MLVELCLGLNQQKLIWKTVPASNFFKYILPSQTSAGSATQQVLIFSICFGNDSVSVLARKKLITVFFFPTKQECITDEPRYFMPDRC